MKTKLAIEKDKERELIVAKFIYKLKRIHYFDEILDIIADPENEFLLLCQLHGSNSSTLTLEELREKIKTYGKLTVTWDENFGFTEYESQWGPQKHPRNRHPRWSKECDKYVSRKHSQFRGCIKILYENKNYEYGFGDVSDSLERLGLYTGTGSSGPSCSRYYFYTYALDYTFIYAKLRKFRREYFAEEERLKLVHFEDTLAGKPLTKNCIRFMMPLLNSKKILLPNPNHDRKYVR